MALVRLSYWDPLFPRDSYRLTFERLTEAMRERNACRPMADC